MEQGVNNDEFVTQFIIAKEVEKNIKNLKEYLNREIEDTAGDRKKTVFINAFPQDHKQISPYANSFSAIVTLSNDLLVLEYLGGATATSLLGRFTLNNKPLQQHCKSLVAMESASNPDVIFFDLAYMSEGYVDNINRRASIYDFQLSLLNYDQSNSPLCLNDIVLSIHQGEVIIHSQSLNKRLVPRMASAYNYTRSDLPIFRLLCDIQNQSLITNPLFKLEDLLPGLNYYPRVQYKNIVISPAKWRIKKRRLSGLVLPVNK